MKSLAQVWEHRWVYNAREKSRCFMSSSEEEESLTHKNKQYQRFEIDQLSKPEEPTPIGTHYPHPVKLSPRTCAFRFESSAFCFENSISNPHDNELGTKQSFCTGIAGHDSRRAHCIRDKDMSFSLKILILFLNQFCSCFLNLFNLHFVFNELSFLANFNFGPN